MTDVEEVKNRTDIVALISEYIPLKKAGRNFRANCPFHQEKSPSFMVSPELAIWKCFGCGLGGDVFAFLERMEGMEFGEALKSLAVKAGVTLTEYRPGKEAQEKERLVAANNLASEFYHYLLTKHVSGKKALEYLERRGIGEEAIETFKIGWAAPSGGLARYLTGKKGFKPEELVRAGLLGRGYDFFRGRVVFPLRNHRGETVGFSGRLLPGDPQEGRTGKYINTPETGLYHKGEILYGLDVTRGEVKRAGVAVVVEGELDLISSFQSGVKNVVAIKGSALTEMQIKLLRRFCESLVMALDSDAAGDAAARRGVATADREGMTVKVVETGEYKDPDDFAQKDPDGWKRAVAEAVGIYDFYIDSAVSRFGINTAEGKKKIGRELIPIWADISDEIVKSHYVKKLADELGVSEEAVWAEVNKESRAAGKGEKEVTPAEKEVKTRREMLEEHLVAVALRLHPDKLLNSREILVGVWGKRLVERLEEYLQKKKWSVKEFVQWLPAEMSARVGELLLADLDEDEVWLGKEFERTKTEIKRVEIKDRLENLSKEISVREKGGQEIERLQQEFVKLSQNLTGML